MKTIQYALLVIAVIPGWPALLIGQEDTRAPLPNAEAQQKAMALVSEVYKAEHNKANRPSEKETLATKLLEVAGNTKDVSDRYALLCVARDLSLEAGGPTCLRAVDEMAKTYQIDGAGIKLEVIARCSSSIRTSEQGRVIAEAGIALLNQALANDAFPVAERLHNATLSAARKTRDRDLVNRVVALNAKVTEVAQAAAEAKLAFDLLRTNPADPAANLAAGKYHCFLKGDWANGLSMLALCNDPAIQLLAEKEKRGASTPDDEVALADGWWSIAERESGTAQGELRAHAASWYKKALPQLAGLEKAKVEKRLGRTPLAGDISVRSPSKAEPQQTPRERAGSSKRVLKACDQLVSKEKPKGLNKSAIPFSAPAGNGRGGGNGFIVEAPSGWEEHGTTWNFKYNGPNTSFGFHLIHPFKNGHVLVRVLTYPLRGSRITVCANTPWRKGGWMGESDVEVEGIVPVKNVEQILMGNEPVEIVSSLSHNGAYRLYIGGKLVANANVKSASSLDLSNPEDEKIPYGSGWDVKKFQGKGLPMILKKGQAGIIVGPTDSGKGVAQNIVLMPAKDM